ncbi:MAG: metallophosphoesterase [Clostridia bacterium]|nr:metallophosphoesterase [Clostridia bacterium]
MRFIVGIIIVFAVFGSANYYIARRIWQCIHIVFPKLNKGIFLGVLALLMLLSVIGFAKSFLPLPDAVKSVVGAVGMYWLGIFIFFLVFFLLADCILLLGKFARLIPSPLPEKVRLYSGLAVVLVVGFLTVYGIYNAKQISFVSYDIPLEENRLDGEMNVVLISDLHLGALGSESKLINAVEKINELKPDMVCIAGDIFDNDFYAVKNPEKAAEALKGIRTRYGVFACLGNHDAGTTVDEMLSFLEQSNVKILLDEYTVIDNRLILVGRVDGDPIGGFPEAERKTADYVLADVDKNLPVLVMDHNPSNIDEYGNEVDLIVSGHTHKGQIFPGNLITNMIYTVDYGHYRKNSDSPHVVVTSGLGTWGMPMRVGTKSEIVSIKLN